MGDAVERQADRRYEPDGFKNEDSPAARAEGQASGQADSGDDQEEGVDAYRSGIGRRSVDWSAIYQRSAISVTPIRAGSTGIAEPNFNYTRARGRRGFAAADATPKSRRASAISSLTPPPALSELTRIVYPFCTHLSWSTLT
ncbi:MAG: hypothetical protein H0W90_13660 [Actinobacteria bacterium]|nr:hypothetical protein [Actinomycetota bacterium]